MAVSFRNLFKVKEIRNRILITLGLLMIYRLGFYIPIPGVDYNEAFKGAADDTGFLRMLGIMNVLTGARLQQATLFSLGVMPYISASIIFSLLTKIVPALEKLAKEGASGQKKINQYTRLATVPICFLQSFFVIFGVLSVKDQGHLLHPGVNNVFWLYAIVVMVTLTAGTLFVMWLGEQITEHGIGNGTSLIIMAGIIAQLFPALTGMWRQNESAGTSNEAYQTFLLFIFAWGVAVVAVVFMTKAQRRIPIQQAKQTRGRKVYGGQRHFLPLKVNHSGVMPIIFASALLVIPSILGQALTNVFPSFGYWLSDAFTRGTGFWYIAAYSVLIFFFSFFWTSLMFQPNEMAENLKEYGSFIPGIRPGKKTAEFLEQTMLRITLAGAGFLTIVAVFPSIVGSNLFLQNWILLYFMSGTSILIVVGVALDLVEKLNAMLIMRNYEGFMKDGGPGVAGGWGRQVSVK
jgi:preprotein translocase subunit SecY